MTAPSLPLSPLPLDRSRSTTLEALTHAVGRGALDLAEFDRRSAAVVAASTDRELAALTEDLAVPVATTTASRPSALAAAWWTWAGVGALCIVIWLATCIGTGQMLYPWPVWVFGPWGVVLAFQTVGERTGFAPHQARVGCSGPIDMARWSGFGCSSPKRR